MPQGFASVIVQINALWEMMAEWEESGKEEPAEIVFRNVRCLDPGREDGGVGAVVYRLRAEKRALEGRSVGGRREPGLIPLTRRGRVGEAPRQLPHRLHRNPLGTMRSLVDQHAARWAVLASSTSRPPPGSDSQTARNERIEQEGSQREPSFAYCQMS